MYIDGKLLSGKRTGRIEIKGEGISLSEISEGVTLVFPNREERVIKKRQGLTSSEGNPLVTLLQQSSHSYTLAIKTSFCDNPNSKINPHSNFYEKRVEII